MVIMLNPKKASPAMYGDGAALRGAPILPPQDRRLTITQRRQGYDNAVDWWALGITIYKLLTSVRPFAHDEIRNFVPIHNPLWLGILKENLHFRELTRLFQVVQYPSYMSAEAVDLVGRLLEIDPQTRLGSGRQGLRNLKKHPFFRGIDWNRLEQKQLDPPELPPCVLQQLQQGPGAEESEKPVELRKLLASNHRWDWFDTAPDVMDQKYFTNWWA